MDNSFISKDNIENIYEYINVYFVKNHNYNLNSYENYKKIIKKLSKTIFNSINENDSYKNIVMNDFNDIVLNKSIEFLLKDINTKNRKNNIDVKSSNSTLIESTLLDNTDDNIVEPKKKKKSKKVKYNNNINSDVFNSFSQNDDQIISNQDQNQFVNKFDTFNDQVKAANKKIKDNFEQITSQSQDNFQKHEPPSPQTPSSENNNNISDKLAFEKILEDKIDKNTLSDSTGSLYDDYSNANVQDMLTSIIFKQKDNSKSNQLESYEGEEYLPNLITPVGEEAPIQPLIYQNTGSGSERIDKKVITIDSGSTNNGLNSVTNLGTNNWYRFKIDLQDTVKIDKLCDIYLRNITVIGLTNNVNCPYLALDIDEFNIRNYSNNPNMRNKIAVINTITNSDENIPKVVDGTPDTVTITLDDTTNLKSGMIVSGTNIANNTFISSVNNSTQITISTAPELALVGDAILTFTPFTSFNVNYSSEDNYITTINPEKLTNLTITLTNQDNNSIDDAANNTFISSSNPLNRIIFELEFRSRGERDDLIYETNMYSSN
jgi:hypothetical protein